MLLYLGGTRQFNLKSGMGGTAGRQLMAPHGCAAEENQHHSPQAGALRGTRILHKATMSWGAPTVPPASQDHQGACQAHPSTPYGNLLPALAGTLSAAPG